MGFFDEFFPRGWTFAGVHKSYQFINPIRIDLAPVNLWNQLLSKNQSITNTVRKSPDA